MAENKELHSVGRAIFKAIHEGKWLSIQYQNQSQQVTRYWIAIKSLSPDTGKLKVDGLHLGKLTVQEFSIRAEGILWAQVIEGSWCETNPTLVQDILDHPRKYQSLFGNTINLRILEYLALCNKLDKTPYSKAYTLVEKLDADSFSNGILTLTQKQFEQIVQQFQYNASQQKKPLPELGLNSLSIHTDKGLYVLAYRPLYLDIINRQFRAREQSVVCREFTIEGMKVSAHAFLDGEDYGLLEDFDRNAERIKDCITAHSFYRKGVDDMPYLVAVQRENFVDLEHQYQGILNLFQSPDHREIPMPLRAFFGEMTARPRRRKSFPLTLVSSQVNLDQLLAMNKAMRYPIAYVQGPPGTGKTSTIVNTITTAFFNGRTVLFTSYNNHPIDGVVEKLQALCYKGKQIPFPFLRLGSNVCVEKALDTILQMYEECKDITVYTKTLDRNHDKRVEDAKQLTQLLEQYEEILDLEERKETIQRLLDSPSDDKFKNQLEQEQLPKIQQQLEQKGTINTKDALDLLDDAPDEFLKYLYYTSVLHIQRLGEPKNKDLLDILYSDETPSLRVSAFNAYLSHSDNLKKFLRIFPCIATTCISAQKLGQPEVLFDMVIMDEASQCNTAVSLVPILRGSSLMLVGDPQQLRPVIVMPPEDSELLRQRYHVSKEYDYIQNSIYKCFLACDSVSDEVLLRHHYRCDPKIIEFNNKKYYNNRLMIATESTQPQPLVYIDVSEDTSTQRNTAPMEVELIHEYLTQHPDTSVGIITPFTNQRELIQQMLAEHHHTNANCGTVHAFQGDEKDVILFSLALTNQTPAATYAWLKNNKELINVATSRARQQLIVIGSNKELQRLHSPSQKDDMYELVEYVRSNGTSKVSPNVVSSRALGIQPYSSEIETSFLQTLNHALGNVFSSESRCSVRRNVPVGDIFPPSQQDTDLFHTGRLNFVVYRRQGRNSVPVVAIELDGSQHRTDPTVQQRDAKKQQICQENGFEWIRVDNTYARRYQYIKDILAGYFRNK